MKPIIKTLTKEYLGENIRELLSLENNWSELGEIPWTDRNFYMELPGKWDMSALAFVDDKIVGYTVATLEDKKAMLRKILVDRSVRRNGVATGLWDFLREKCRESGAERLEFRVLEDNSSAVDFYKDKNCIFHGSTLGSDNLSRYDIMYVFKTDRIKHSKPTIDAEDANGVFEVINTGDLATGRIVNNFVESFSKYIGKKYGAATNTGASALHLALRALDVKKGDEVIIPSYVCGSVLNVINYCEATPVIADINEKDYNISLNDVRSKLNSKTKAIIVPHMFGNPSGEVEDFMKLNIPIIEDCALSVGAEHNERKVGSFGDISIFSFYATKVMTTGTGGMLLSDNEKIMERVNDLMKYDNRSEFGESYNYKMNDVQASLGLSQLKKLDDFVSKRRQIASTYSSLLSDVKDIKLPESKESMFFRYVIRCEDANSLIENLRSRGVDAAKPIFMPIHRYLNLPDSDFPNTSNAYKEAVSIPIYPNLTKDEIEDVASIVANSEEEGLK